MTRRGRGALPCPHIFFQEATKWPQPLSRYLNCPCISWTRSTSPAEAPTRRTPRSTLAILNVLRVECWPASDTYTVAEPGKRPICPEITSFTAALPLDDGICQGVLPYGLAAHLLLGEDDDKASYFNQRYEEKLAQLRNTPAAWEDITSPYGGIEYGQFGRW